MLYVLNKGGKLSVLTTPEAAAIRFVGVSDRWDWKSFEEVTKIASQLTEDTGVLYIPIDSGEHTSPRYDVTEAPRIGDPISYAFNGDYYPCGLIATISNSMKKITSTDGTTFYRRRNTGAWISNGTWYMVHGLISRQNPEI